MKTMTCLLALMSAWLSPVFFADAESAVPTKVLMVVTSHDTMAGEPTGLWLEEFAVPYKLFEARNYHVTVSSVKGGAAPVDPRSIAEPEQRSPQARELLINTKPLASLDPEDFDGVFFPGGHGTMFDFPVDATVKSVVEHFVNEGKPAAFVCHGPAALVQAVDSEGRPIVKGRKVTGFTNAEEEAVSLVDAVPFLLETRFREQGASFTGAPNFKSHTVVDGNLVTGQNPASSKGAAMAFIQLLNGAEK